MSRPNRVAVATTSQLAADAAQEIAEAGGNAVDCAIAAAMCSINTEPGVCALAGSAYVTIWAPGEDPVTIDGNVAVPGRGRPQGQRCNAETVRMAYGGGIETVIGPASVAVPGTPAALDLASSRYGDLPWRELLGPTIEAAKLGFPLSAACHYYLQFSGDVVFSRSTEGHAALHDDNGRPRPAGSRIVVPGLADSLDAIARNGSREFYAGDIGASIVRHMRDSDGLLTQEDLAQYRATSRSSLTVNAGDWVIASNPPPAIGGAVLCAMLLAFRDYPLDAWDEAALEELIRVQRAALSYRRANLDLADDVTAPVAELIEQARCGQLLSRWSSGSTVHTSVVDENGLACAITASSGYGSGEMPPGTGLWLNNSLGEIELNRRGLDAGPPGRRLPSNMAPGAARCGKVALAMGSPGADRITTALHQFLANHIQRGLDLDAAIAHPRLHVVVAEAGDSIAIEPGLEVGAVDLPVKRHPEIGMYFGGVVAASYHPQKGLTAAADPRREGGTYISP